MNAYIIAGFRSAVGKAPRGTFRFTRLPAGRQVQPPDLEHETTFVTLSYTFVLHNRAR
jgi:hypothetical protein